MTITEVLRLVTSHYEDVEYAVLDNLGKTGALKFIFYKLPRITLWVSKEHGCPWSVLITFGDPNDGDHFEVIDRPHALATAVLRAADTVGLLASQGVSHGA